MKTIILCLLLSFLFFNCERRIDTIMIDPAAQPSALSRALEIVGKNITGSIPTTNQNFGIDIINAATSASVTTGNSLFLPYVLSINSSTQVKGVYLQIVGADNYWNIPVTMGTSSNSFYSYVLDVAIPLNILNGNFKIVYYIYDANGNISEPINMNVGILPTLNYCEQGSNQNLLGVAGSDGIAVRSYTFGDTEGWVYIDYDTYSVPDRMDVKYGGDWVASTGTILKNNEVPPIKLCSQVTGIDGFRGTSNTFKVYYDPKKSKRIDIYASGCLEGGTGWTFKIRDCPKP